MKNINKYLLLPICLLSTSCNWFPYWNEEVKTELEKLPPATQSGEYTFGCLVNGKAFVPPVSYSMTAIFQRGQLQFGAGYDLGNSTQDINFIVGDPLVENLKYSFTDTSHYYNAQFLDYTRDRIKCLYEFKDTFEGWIIFTNIDRMNYIISGTF